MYLEAWTLGRLAKTASFVLRNSSAAFGDDTMTVGTWPSLMDMMGPYILAKFCRFRCGRADSMWRLPMIGSGHGPGASFRAFFRSFCGRRMEQRDLRKTIRRRIASSNIIEVGDIF